jgi:gamma-glutamyltranspeptidase / glutathione hydrolase
VPTGCGFTLQNRGHNFSLVPGHLNQIAPRKRPYHTIIPALITSESDGSLFATLGVMGGFMQPQGHLQVIRNLIDHQMDAQSALDAPRWYVSNVGETQHPKDVQTSKILLEDRYGGRRDQGSDYEDDGQGIKEALIALGHNVIKIVTGEERSVFGRGQVIIRYPNGVLSGGSDPRADGCALPCVFPSTL